MALRIHHIWHPVIGQRVQMRRGGIIVREGIVDAVTLDDSVLWIAGGGCSHGPCSSGPRASKFGSTTSGSPRMGEPE
ncbi:hypothetical protein ABIE00_005073 [Arthrobacter sp. OAP107]